MPAVVCEATQAKAFFGTVDGMARRQSRGELGLTVTGRQNNLPPLLLLQVIPRRAPLMPPHSANWGLSRPGGGGGGGGGCAVLLG